MGSCVLRHDGEIMQRDTSALHKPCDVCRTRIAIQPSLEALYGISSFGCALGARSPTRWLVITIEASQTCAGRRSKCSRLRTISIGPSPGKSEPMIRIVQAYRNFLYVGLRKIIVSWRMGAASGLQECLPRLAAWFN